VARKKIVADLEAQGLLGAIKDYTNNVGHCDRCKTVVEPRLSTQWFIAVNKEPNGGGESMAEKARAAVRADSSGKKAIRFTPENYEKIYLNWMEDIHDWCISRQLWWGHRIPAWHCAVCHKITVPQPGATGDPVACAHCGSEEITQETDVLDTWFSSGLLPVSVFGWPNLTPENRADFDAFYPTSPARHRLRHSVLLGGAHDHAGLLVFGDVPMADGSPRPLAESVPFREVYIHALVRDANREKMSKTKGNVIDPIEIVKQYGTDAVRFTLASMASPGTDIAFNVARTEGYRAFANKIWNAARFIFMNVDRAAEVGITVDRELLGAMPTVDANAPLEARWIVAELHATAAKVNESLENYRYDEAASIIYQFFWGSFCDWYLEIVKLRLDFEGNQVVNGTEGQIRRDLEGTRAALVTLVSVFEAALRLLSPFMPFITEELWHAVYDGKAPARSIALTKYPMGDEHLDDPALIDMGVLQSLIVETRALRKEIGVEEKASTPIEVRIDRGMQVIIGDNCAIVERLARVNDLRFVDHITSGLSKHSTFNFDVAVIYERIIDVVAERERLTKEIAKYEKGLAAAERQLGNEAFLAKAPAHVVEGLKKQEAETRLLLEKARAALEVLPGE
jgi:valyl-tRNA synthetase